MALAPLHLFKLKQLSVFLFMLPSKITYDQKNSKAKNVQKNASLIFQATFGRRKGVLGQGNILVPLKNPFTVGIYLPFYGVKIAGIWYMFSKYRFLTYLNMAIML